MRCELLHRPRQSRFARARVHRRAQSVCRACRQPQRTWFCSHDPRAVLSIIGSGKPHACVLFASLKNRHLSTRAY